MSGSTRLPVHLLASLLVLLTLSLTTAGSADRLQIGVLKRPAECPRVTKNGDKILVHYVGSLAADKSVFDSSRETDEPLPLVLGSGSVISGWEKGLLGMCEGEVRKLKIPPSLGYGVVGFPPKIPENAHLVFNVELMGFEDPDVPDMMDPQNFMDFDEAQENVEL